MIYKAERLSTRLVAAARSGERYKDVHVFLGGTGAVAGTALLKMLELYEEMIAIQPPSEDEVPILLATGLNAKGDIRDFKTRLYRWAEARYGSALKPRKVRNGFLTHSGVFIVTVPLVVEPLPDLADLVKIPPEDRPAKVAEYLSRRGAGLNASAEEVYEVLSRELRCRSPFTDFLKAYRHRHLTPESRFRTVVQGIPLPSLVAYKIPALEEIASCLRVTDKSWLAGLRQAFQQAICDDTATVRRELADRVLVAHTTAVGGMYDKTVDGSRVRTEFAHSAVDDRLEQKKKAADTLTELYTSAGIDLLITAAAIGVDEVQIRQSVTVHGDVQQMLADLDRPLFKGSKELLPPEAWKSVAAGRQVPRPQRVRTARPLTVPLGEASHQEVEFERGVDIIPSCVIRSGENGYFSVANAETLYRVMRVASASELGLFLASTGLFGDDPDVPSFKDHVCYYTESDNSRQVFDFLAQPPIRQAQLNGLDPMALQDLGNAKHQGELHTLGILILHHRLRTLDVDAIEPYVDEKSFDPASFFVRYSEALRFEDVLGWKVEELAETLRILVSADRPADLEPLTPFKRTQVRELFPRRKEARERVFVRALEAVWNVPSLGSPLVYEIEGQTWVRTGYFAAPLKRLVEYQDSIDLGLRELHAIQAPDSEFATFQDHILASRGFVDLRPHAVVTWGEPGEPDFGNRVARATTVAELEEVLARIPPYTAFSTCGLLAVVYRLQMLGERLGAALMELGTLQDSLWQMPRDEIGHLLVVPGVVDAFRMESEGREKSTGSERLAGWWGYRPLRADDRRDSIPIGADIG